MTKKGAPITAPSASNHSTSGTGASVAAPTNAITSNCNRRS